MKHGTVICSSKEGCAHPILPLKNLKNKEGKKYGYANTFCYKVAYNSEQKCSQTIVAKGFPDKGDDEYIYVDEGREILINNNYIKSILQITPSFFASPIFSFNIFIID